MKTNEKKTIVLSEEQNPIINWFKGTYQATCLFLLIIARAGCGKTFTVLRGILESLELKKPGAVCLYVAFMKRNQTEAMEKINHPQVQVRTFSSIGYEVIRMAFPRAKSNPFCEWNRVQKICPDLKDAKLTYLVANIANLIDYAKCIHIGLPSLELLQKIASEKDICANPKDEKLGWNTEKICDIAQKAINLALTEPIAEFSFSDMAGWLPVSLSICKKMFDLIVMDEGQDLTLLQLTMAKAILKDGGRMAIVGDNFQAMYSWRGALPDGLFKMKSELQAEELKLTKTFRCGKIIVSKANVYVSDFTAFESNHEGEILHLNDAEMITKAVPGQAILSRLNAPLMRHALRLIQAGKPAKIEGKDIAAQLENLIKTIADSVNDIATFDDKLAVWERVMISKVSPNSRNAAQRLENIQDNAATLRAISQVSHNVSDMVLRINSIFQSCDSQYAKPADKIISLSTIHKAKGLEWKTVYVLEDTFTVRSENEVQAQEEKNIRYVAYTRAINTLVLVTPAP